jgi:putative transposase
MMKAVVHSGEIIDQDGAFLVLGAVYEACQRLELIWADMGYRGKELRKWIEEVCQWRLEIVKRPSKWGWYAEDVEPPPKPAFTVLPRHWVVERTFAWIGRYRRMSKDYEYLTESSETMVCLAMTRLMLKRLSVNAPYGVPSRQRQGVKR